VFEGVVGGSGLTRSKAAMITSRPEGIIMATKVEQLPDLEVVLTCTKCDTPHTPHTKAQIMGHCVQCGTALDVKNGPPELHEFMDSVNALLTEAFKTTALSRALKTATAKSDKAQTLFAISIRARRAH
jgi:hypothetical protein